MNSDLQLVTDFVHLTMLRMCVIVVLLLAIPAFVGFRLRFEASGSLSAGGW